ncbi:hypothetical protein [Teredinibacter haidensis]|uniref:hypothetical protein n=1 Tax=Teredinibacter haidensis TaxID=2731755 RepID=UPI000948BB02|nr:hypothetical protein [Teredinibacter haidensis]
MEEVIDLANRYRQQPITKAVCDRGYGGVKEAAGVMIVLPKKALKRDSRYQRDQKRKMCRQCAAIEPLLVI